MAIRDDVRLHLQQLGSGTVRPVGGGPFSGERFCLDLKLEAPCLERFLKGPLHEVHLRKAGSPAAQSCVEWTRDGATHVLPVTGGQMRLFREEPDDPRHKYYDIAFCFRGPDGTPLRFTAVKNLQDNGFLDLLDAARDLSVLRCARLTHALTDQLLYEGDLSVHLDESLKELDSLGFVADPPLRPAEEQEARQAFYAFMNRELAEVYSGLPLLLGRSGFLNWAQQAAVLLVADVMLPEDRRIPPAEVLASLERFLAQARAPLLKALRAALGALGAVEGLLRLDRTRLRAWCVRELQGPPGKTRDVLELLHRVITLPYYAHPEVDSQVGHHRYGQPQHPRPPRAAPATVEAPADFYDFVIAGAGPAGCLLAERLTAAGHRVLLLEAGRAHAEAQFQGDELQALAALYKHAGLQLAKDPGDPGDAERMLTVLQGEGVGGGALVNNAVCLQLPARTQSHWASLGFPHTGPALDAAYRAVKEELGIHTVSEALAHGAQANPASAFLAPALGARLQPCEVNLERGNGRDDATGCLGCGRCNVGCSYGRRRHALSVHLPRALQRGLHLLAEARLEGLELGDGGRVHCARVQRRGELLRVRARHFILSCGPVGSSLALHHTGGLPQRVAERVGDRFSANVGAPVHAFVDRPVHAGNALAMGHYYLPDADAPGFVVETWFNPPGTQSLAMPGHLQVHAARMQRYARLLAAGALVGVDPSGRVERDGELVLPVRRVDLQRLQEGLVTLARAFFDPRNPGATEEVLIPTREGLSLRSPAEVERYAREFTDLRALSVGTGHPQGGSCLSEDPAISVVDGDFRVRGVDNLYVCDASVFPASAGVNPQWTVLALAHLCAERLLARS